MLFKDHPYRWSPIGQIPHLRAASIDVQAFWEKVVVPNNATLVIVDQPHADAQALAEKYFGWIPKCPAPARRPPRAAQPRRGRARISEDKVRAHCGLRLSGRADRAQDAVPLEMLMTSSAVRKPRLNQDLVKNQNLPGGDGRVVSLEDDGLAGAGRS